ncbi:Ankrd49, partial [Symbiodinium microadriaticum]
SHTVLHGRPFPLNGSVFANIFVHFEPIDHAEMNRKAMDSRKKLGQPAPEYKEDDGGGDPVPVVPAVDPAEEARLRINHASSGNRLEEVQRILHADPSSVNTADRNGWMPLHEAVRGGHTDLVKFLVEMGADIGAVTNGGGTALWWARRLLAPGHSAIAYLTDIGAPEGSDTNTVL